MLLLLSSAARACYNCYSHFAAAALAPSYLFAAVAVGAVTAAADSLGLLNGCIKHSGGHRQTTTYRPTKSLYRLWSFQTIIDTATITYESHINSL